MDILKRFFFLLAVITPALAFISCSGDEDDPQDVSVSDQKLLVDEVYNLPSGTWRSSNNMVAKVEGSKVVAVRQGEAIINGTSKSFKVKVSPSNNILPEPYLQFGGSQSDVKDYMASLNGFDTPGLSLVQTYVRTNPSPLGYQYTFKNREGLQSVIVMAFQKNFTVLEIAEYLKQRYIPVDEKDGVFGFISLDKKITVVFTITVINGNITYIIQYSPFKPS